MVIARPISEAFRNGNADYRMDITFGARENVDRGHVTSTPDRKGPALGLGQK